MKVLKFGGTSVGTAESLTNVKQIVTACKGQVIVVVSALGGVTNQLIQMADLAEAHSDEWESILEQVKARHMSVIDAVVPDDRQAQCKTVIEGFISEGLYSYYAMLYANNQLPPAYKEQLRDAIVSHGEIMSSAIVASMIDGAVPHYAPNFIKTKDVDYERILDNASFELITKEFGGRLEQVHVTQGFIAEDSTDGKKTNLGRGGSDFTAALIAAALDAEALEIWTDVDGFMTADPRTNPDATVIPQMTYAQAQEMCEAGAKVIYTPTLGPVAFKHIPVWVKNTFNPSATGTVILDPK
ncbi:MAG: aspartate kinase [Bacteroidales bacterium]|nr:aspartate kinase [Bacteroidales bacterium]MDY4141412.1 aspartate kinase [Sodaliphilus sp.]MCI6293455.1 aspartate kinase [Bacteroidales bacterium]MCI6747595.1 aspartate kinase [Bacteroidales bacterium]MCI7490064.1 aspartate kinase [Bacteroidales bacterium]